MRPHKGGLKKCVTIDQEFLIDAFFPSDRVICEKPLIDYQARAHHIGFLKLR